MKKLLSLSALYLSAACLCAHSPTYAKTITHQIEQDSQTVTNNLEKGGNYLAEGAKKVTEETIRSGKGLVNNIIHGFHKLTESEAIEKKPQSLKKNTKQYPKKSQPSSIRQPEYQNQPQQQPSQPTMPTTDSQPTPTPDQSKSTNPSASGEVGSDAAF